MSLQLYSIQSIQTLSAALLKSGTQLNNPNKLCSVFFFVVVTNHGYNMLMKLV